MLIRVVYQDFKYDFVKTSRLDEFIETGRVAMFRRKSGWVIVGIDPIRKNRQFPALPEDRRSSGDNRE